MRVHQKKGSSTMKSSKKNTPMKKKKEIVQEESSSSSDEGEELMEDDSSDEEESNSDDDDNIEKKKGFTDENSSWLKPKYKAGLLDSDSDDDNDDNSNDESAGAGGDSDSDDSDMLEIERESKMIDEQLAIEQEEADTELRRTIAENTSTFHLPTAEEMEDELDGTRVVPPSEIRERINDILTVLADFKNRRESNRSRTEYISQLNADMAELFGYLPELVEYFLTMFNPAETLEFLEASDSSRPLVIRTNTLKTRRKDLAASLLKRGVTLDPLATWSKVGLKITASPIPIGATPEYLSGQYMLQSAASFCPVLALNPSPGKEVVLDLSAAPGGKTSYLAQLMRNTGTIVANDLKPERQKATVANMHRLGVRNVVTCCYDGRLLGKLWKNRFTKILLDAPCSGLGVISRDPSVKVQRTIKDVEKCGVLQKELLLNAIDALNHKAKGGGIMVYSTCSVSVTENEEVVNYLLTKRDVKLLDAGLDFGKPGFTRYQQKRFHPSIAKTRRFYPHVHNMDGFYVAKILKLSDRRPCDEDDDTEKDADEKQIENEEEGSNDGDEKEVDWGARVKAQVSKAKGKKRGHEGAGKKGQTKGGNAKDQKPPSKKQKGNGSMSVPPARVQKKEKKSTNAKVTKPRRRKQTVDEM